MAVVGPNGSGKSNLTDAVRYCLGEQSSKVLRASKLEELVFAGTPERPGAQFSEVTAVFDNSDGHLAVDFSEVAITRRTTRDGDSQFFINKAACRRRDVHELLMGSGIGPGSFSVLGSKEVDMVLSSDPKERRQMLEETAGTNRYRFRKNEASRRLEQTRQNVVRLHDILTEVTASASESHKAVDRCHRYKKAQQQLRELDINLSQANYNAIKQQNAQASLALDEAQRLSIQADQYEQETNAALEAVEQARTQRQEQHQQILQVVAQLREQLSSSKASHEALFRQAKQIEQNSRSAGARLDNIQERWQERQKELVLLRAALPELNDQAQQAAEQLQQLQQQFEACPQVRSGNTAEIRAKLAQLDRRRSQLQARQESLKARNEQYQQRQQEAEMQASAYLQEAQPSPTAALSAEEVTKAQTASLQAAEEEQQTAKQGQALRQSIIQTRTKRQETEKRRRPLATRVMELEAVLEDRVGLPPAVRTVLNWRESGTIGVIAELIKTKPGLEAAMEAALGGRLSDIVTEDRQAASRLIDRLKRERAGRVTFWPLDLERRELEPIALPTQQGVVGQAMNLISFPSNLRPVLSQMLGQTVIMQDLPSALALYDKCRGRRPHLVTLQGEHLSPIGAVTGGAIKGDRSGMLVRRQQLDTARQTLEDLDTQVSDLIKLEETQTQQLAQAELALTKAREATRHSRQQVADLQAELHRHDQDALRAAQAAEKLQAEAAQLKQRIETQNAELATLEQNQNTIEDEWDQLRSQLTRSQEEDAEIQLQRERLRRQILDANLTTSKAAQALEDKNRQIAELQKRCEELLEDKQQANDEISQAGEMRGQIDLEEQQLQQSIAELTASLAKQEVSVADYKEQYEQQDAQQKALRQQQALASKKARELGEKLRALETEQHASQLSLRQAEQQLAELNITEAAPTPPDFDLAKSEAQARRLRGYLENFGSVNLGAIEDYERLSARQQQLTEQISDLEQASASFTSIMQEMDRASVLEFKKVFAEVNKTFGRLFSEIFAGGWARLELQNPDDWLESGVEIIACPPGKKMQNLMLFSSGERALAAIAFLLSLLTHKPSPVVVLDELDAPLDDSNVEKIAARLKEYSASTQFLVITHNRKTMEYADRLYGVTMEEPGVSKLLSVELCGSEGQGRPLASTFFTRNQSIAAEAKKQLVYSGN